MFAPLLLVAVLAAAPRVAPAPAPPADPWATMLAQATPAIVSIDILATRAFDTENATHSFATGFVVDARRGIILTNRHVVTPGPVRSEALTQQNEVVPLRALYRDPVHDFGFYQYDPATVKFSTLGELALDASAVRVGQEIRVVGNNAGEKLSIHAGTVARLDREAPKYGRAAYNDFNTFYIQAAAGTTGGSSGSPVLDLSGKVVALNAGSRRDSSASFYLPLDRVARALERIQAGQAVTRGTVQAVFAVQEWDELGRLGLPDATQAAARARNPAASGLLVVSEVQPGGPAAGKLQVGDVLLQLDGAPLDSFVPLEAAMDDRVGGVVRLRVARAGVESEVELTVADLHALTPSRYVELGGDLVHELSYQQSRNFNLPARGMYVAAAGYALKHAGVPEGARIDKVAGRATPDLATFREVVGALPDRALVPLQFVTLSEPLRPQVVAWRVDRTWFPAQTCVRDDTTGEWPCEAWPAAAPAVPPTPQVASASRAPAGPPGKIASALVWVEARLPFVFSGNNGDMYSGVGLVIDADQGLVAVDRDTVPQGLADISVVVGAVRVPAEPVWFHPDHNLAVVRFDPAAVTGVKLGEARFDTRRPEVGTRVWQVGLNSRLEIIWGETAVQGYRPFTLGPPGVPQYRDHDVDVMSTTDAALERGGVLVDAQGEVVAFLASFLTGSGRDTNATFRGLPSDVLADAATAFRAGRTPPGQTLGVSWAPLPLALAVDRGMPPAEAAAHAAAGVTRVLAVTHVSADSRAVGQLEAGDLLVSVGGRRSGSWRTLDQAVQDGLVELQVVRAGQVVDVRVPPVPARSGQVDRAVLWAGALVQDTPPELGLQQGLAAGGAYVSWRWFGSPADRYDLDPTLRIVAVDGVPVANLAAFEAAVRGRADGATVRLDVRDLDDRPRVLTLRVDNVYWAPSVVERVGAQWQRRPL